MTHTAGDGQTVAESAPDSESALRTLAALADGLGLESIAADAKTFAARVAEGRFYLACVGQFKRGKSSLLNALLGEPLLPAGVTPVTAVVTVVRHGSPRRARIQLAGERWEDVPLSALPEYVAEQHNPENAKGVVAVEVFVPSPLLASGMCLVDTPGIGSVFAGNTAVTHAFLPHIDACLVVLGADPPISADELALIREVGEQVDRFVVVLNKADRLADAERAEARAFCARVLAERLGRPVGQILEVSATERLARTGPPRDWDALLDALGKLAGQSGATLVRAAEARGLRVLAARMLREIDEHTGALERPLEESERRIDLLRRCAADAERSMQDLTYLINAEQDRLRRAFADHQQRFLDRALPEAKVALLAQLRSAPVGSRSVVREESYRLAQDIFHRTLDVWRAEEQPAAESLYRDAMKRFVELGNAFLARVAASGALQEFGAPGVLADERGFRTQSRLYFTEILRLTGRSPLGWLVDRSYTRGAFLRRVGRDAVAYLEQLIFTNASRLTSDLDEQVAVSRQRLEADLRGQLRGIYQSAEAALERARAQHGLGEEATRAELQHLRRIREEVTAITVPEGEA